MKKKQDTPTCILLHATYRIPNSTGYPCQLLEPFGDATFFENLLLRLKTTLPTYQICVVCSDTIHDDPLTGPCADHEIEVVRISMDQPWAPTQNNCVEITWPWQYQWQWGAYHTQGLQHLMGTIEADCFVLMNANLSAMAWEPAIKDLVDQSLADRRHLYSESSEIAVVLREADLLDALGGPHGFPGLTLNLLAQSKHLRSSPATRSTAMLHQPVATPTDVAALQGRISGDAASQDDPKTLAIEITTRGAGGKGWQSEPASDEDMPLDAILAAMSSFSPFWTTVRFCGRGDPLLHPDIFRILERAHAKGFRTCVETSPEILLEVDAGRFARTAPDILVIAIREDQAKRDQVAQWLKIFKDALTRRSILCRIVFLWEAWTDSQAVMNQVRALWENMPGRLVLVPFNDYAGHRRVSESVFLLPKNDDEDGVGNLCIQLQSEIMLRVDGKVSLCSQDVVGEVAVGDAKESDLSELWCSGVLSKKRRMYVHKGPAAVSALCARCGEAKMMLAPKWPRNLLRFTPEAMHARYNCPDPGVNSDFVHLDELEEVKISGLGAPVSILADEIDGSLWVADYCQNKVCWLTKNGKYRKTFDINKPARVRWYQGSVVVASENGRVYVISKGQMKRFFTCDPGNGWLIDIAVAGDDIYAAVFEQDNNRIVCLNREETAYELHARQVRWIESSHDSQILWVGSWNGIYGLSDGECQKVSSCFCECMAVVSADRALASANNALILLDTKTWEILQRSRPLVPPSRRFIPLCYHANDLTVYISHVPWGFAWQENAKGEGEVLKTKIAITLDSGYDDA